MSTSGINQRASAENYRLPATVDIFDGETLLGAATVDNSGAWQITDLALNKGKHQLTARSGDVRSAVWNINVAPIPPLEIENSPLALTAKIVRASWAPPNPPEGTFATRSASGGTPPYTYTVDSTAVDIDQNSGRVISFRNGIGLVTVTDINGQSASYSVLVSNVWEIDGFCGLQFYLDAVQIANGYEQGRLPTLEEWRQLRLAYNNAPLFIPAEGDGPAWTATGPSDTVHSVFSPNSGAVGSFGPGAIAIGWALVVRRV